MMARTAVVAGTATAVSGSVSRHQQANAQQKAAAQQEEAAQQQQAADTQAQLADMQAQLDASRQPAIAPAAPAGGDDLITKLKELADMKAAGILSDEEFGAAKARLLA